MYAGRTTGVLKKWDSTIAPNLYWDIAWSEHCLYQPKRKMDVPAMSQAKGSKFYSQLRKKFWPTTSKMKKLPIRTGRRTEIAEERLWFALNWECLQSTHIRCVQFLLQTEAVIIQHDKPLFWQKGVFCRAAWRRWWSWSKEHARFHCSNSQRKSQRPPKHQWTSTSARLVCLLKLQYIVHIFTTLVGCSFVEFVR